MLAACASSPAPRAELRVAIAGQVVDRQFRDLVVTLSNAGSVAVHEITLDVELPASLHILSESHGADVTLRDERTANSTHTYIYEVHKLAAGASVVTHLPFRRESSRELAGREVRAIARGRESGETIAKRTFGSRAAPE
jgi:hypothetical protein